MALEASFHELAVAFDRLRNAFVGLRLTVVEDQPDEDSVALVDWLSDFVEDLRGDVEMGVEAVGQGRRAARPPKDPEGAHRSLVTCQDIRDLVGSRLSFELSSQGRLRELRSLGLERGGEWGAWAAEVLGSVMRCRQRLNGLVDPLLACWREVAGELAAPLVSVHATGVGQVIARNGVFDHEGTESRSSTQSAGSSER